MALSILDCIKQNAHMMVGIDDNGHCEICGDDARNAWKCQDCSRTVYRYRGESDVSCYCGASYNAGGQRLRDDWRGNPSWYDEDVSDLEGYERQHANDW